MNAFTIKDLENLSGVKAHTIRIWEQRYSFIKPQRTGTNIRYYSNEELKTILNIALLNRYGYKISHIDKMDTRELEERIQNLAAVHAKQESVLNQLISHMVEMEIDDFDDVLSGYIAAHGIDKTIMDVIFPFLEKVGILWQTNHIYPAQEHLVTNVIRQKLVVGIENVSNNWRSDKLVLLYLPENEFHELGLLYVNYLLKKRGVRSLYLGASLPLKDLEVVVKMKNPLYLHTHLTSVAHNFNLEKYMNQLHQRIPDVPVIISGPVTHDYKKSVPANISFKSTLAEVMAGIENI
ncbi:MerR family transcriptional regulator [Aridibaculum aurantiacum]|uniref:MerR family transcriptional regulator n=1 Tax=Aridibaculum aurantiacum TaxID=2810307 RepID=UPI001A972911|nr:MerR family transcriptional regulator [Aridibaculum aurantiacum]